MKKNIFYIIIIFFVLSACSSLGTKRIKEIEKSPQEIWNKLIEWFHNHNNIIINPYPFESITAEINFAHIDSLEYLKCGIYTGYDDRIGSIRINIEPRRTYTIVSIKLGVGPLKPGAPCCDYYCLSTGKYENEIFDYIEK